MYTVDDFLACDPVTGMLLCHDHPELKGFLMHGCCCEDCCSGITKLNFYVPHACLDNCSMNFWDPYWGYLEFSINTKIRNMQWIGLPYKVRIYWVRCGIELPLPPNACPFAEYGHKECTDAFLINDTDLSFYYPLRFRRKGTNDSYQEELIENTVPLQNTLPYINSESGIEQVYEFDPTQINNEIVLQAILDEELDQDRYLHFYVTLELMDKNLEKRCPNLGRAWFTQDNQYPIDAYPWSPVEEFTNCIQGTSVVLYSPCWTGEVLDEKPDMTKYPCRWRYWQHPLNKKYYILAPLDIAFYDEDIPTDLPGPYYSNPCISGGVINPGPEDFNTYGLGYLEETYRQWWFPKYFGTEKIWPLPQFSYMHVIYTESTCVNGETGTAANGDTCCKELQTNIGICSSSFGGQIFAEVWMPDLLGSSNYLSSIRLLVGNSVKYFRDCNDPIPNDICPTCNGTGQTTCANLADDWFIVPDWSYTTNPCSWNDPPDKIVTCPTCKGNGVIPGHEVVTLLELDSTKPDVCTWYDIKKQVGILTCSPYCDISKYKLILKLKPVRGNYLKDYMPPCSKEEYCENFCDCPCCPELDYTPDLVCPDGEQYNPVTRTCDPI